MSSPSKNIVTIIVHGVGDFKLHSFVAEGHEVLRLAQGYGMKNLLSMQRVGETATYVLTGDINRDGFVKALEGLAGESKKRGFAEYKVGPSGWASDSKNLVLVQGKPAGAYFENPSNGYKLATIAEVYIA